MVSPPLSGETFPLGPTLMKQALISKNKYRFIVDTIQVPNVGDPSNQAWERSISLIHSWILDTLLPSMAQSVVYIKIKKKCFSCLEWFERNIFSRRSLSNCWVTTRITWFKPRTLLFVGGNGTLKVNASLYMSSKLSLSGYEKC